MAALKAVRAAVLLCGIFLLAGPAWGFDLASRVVRHRLANGMVFLIVERRDVPVVSFNLTHRVGAVDEPRGMTGIAHMYEHMAFKGTRTIGTSDYEEERPLLEVIEALSEKIDRERSGSSRRRAISGEGSDESRVRALERQVERIEQEARRYVIPNELGRIYSRNGAAGFNASTGMDLTRYVVSLPSNRLPLWATLEADRLAHPVLREFYTERVVVMEERRQRVESQPGGLLWETFLSTAFAAHPYRTPVIGWGSDIQALTMTQTEEFFHRHYAPNNLVVAVVGDLDAREVIRTAEEVFGKLPSQPPPPALPTVEPPQRGERRAEVEWDAGPQILIGYHKPTVGHPDEEVFDVIDALLTDGRASRLFRSLVTEKRLAVSVSTSPGSPGSRYPNLFTIHAVPRAPHTASEVEAAIYQELERLAAGPIDPKELERVVTQLDAELIRSLQSNSGLAGQLAYFEAVAGDWRYLLRARDRFAATTPADVMRVAKAYFTKNNRTVATLVRPETKQ